MRKAFRETGRALGRLYPTLPLIPAFILALFGLYNLIASQHNEHWLWWTLIGFILFDSLGIQIAYHKLLSHRSFKTYLPIKRILYFLGIFAGQNSPLIWSAIHRSLHHKHTDTVDDIHSPVHGYFHALFLWYFRIPKSRINLHFCRRDLNEPFLIWLHRYHNLITTLTLVVVAAINLEFCIYFFCMPMLLSNLLTGVVNSSLHMGRNLPTWQKIILATYKGTKVSGHALNSLVLGPLTGGLGFHANHHESPQAFNYSKRWYEIDPSVPIIKLIQVRAPKG